MSEAFKLHNAALSWAVMRKRSHSTIKFAFNGQFELDCTNLFADIAQCLLL